MEKLLTLIENNGRASLEELAVLMNLPKEEVAAMLDEAVHKGYIQGYSAMINWDKTGFNRVEAYIELHVTPKRSRGFDEIASAIAAFDEVDSVFLMSGGYDLLVTISGESFQQIAMFVAKRLSTLDDVLSTATCFLLKTYKRGGKFYDGTEADERELVL